MKLISNCFEKQKSVNIQEQRGGVIFSIFLLRKYIFRYEHSFPTRQKEFQMSASHRTHLTLKNSTRVADLERTSGRTHMFHRELQKDFIELRDKLFKAYDDKNNSFVKQVFCERIQDEVLYEIFQTII